jgi:hypothetical protein
MATSFEKVREPYVRPKNAARIQSRLLRNLDSKQRMALELFEKLREIAAKDLADLFGYNPSPPAAYHRPATGVERRKAPGSVVHPSPSPRLYPAPVSIVSTAM